MFALDYFGGDYWGRDYYAASADGAGVVIASAAGSIVSRACTVAFAWRDSTATIISGSA